MEKSKYIVLMSKADDICSKWLLNHEITKPDCMKRAFMSNEKITEDTITTAPAKDAPGL